VVEAVAALDAATGRLLLLASAPSPAADAASAGRSPAVSLAESAALCRLAAAAVSASVAARAPDLGFGPLDCPPAEIRA
jgi:hypothetical protein